MRAVASVILIILLTNSCQQIREQDEIDSIFSKWDNLDTPGGAIGIIQKGKLIFSKGYGLADLEHNVPITPSTVFYIGSTGKQFTAFCLLLLEEQGLINFDNEIQTYLPDFPRYSSPITVRHLVYHTSGIRDYSSIWDLQGTSYYERITAQETYRLIKQQSALNFEPGEEYLYSNSGYFLMAEIFEKASGKSLKEFARENIFEPLKMKSTTFLDDNQDLIKNRAFGYEKKSNDDGFNNLIRRFELVGSGGVYSTVEDLYLWEQNFSNNQLGIRGQRLINKMQEEGTLSNGTTTGRSFGLANSTYKGLNTIFHSGSHGGFKAQLLRFPEQDFSVIVLANRSDASGSSESYKIADLFLKDDYLSEGADKLSASNTDKINMSSEDLDTFTGYYLNRKSGNIRRIVKRDNTLYYYRRESSQDRLGAITKNEFEMVDRGNPVVVKFSTVDGEKVMSYYSNGIHRSDMHRFEPISYSTSELNQFMGKYYCSDIDRIYELKTQGDDLVVSINSKKLFKVSSVSSDILSASSLGILYFERDSNNLLQGFILNSSRVRGLIFEKESN